MKLCIFCQHFYFESGTPDYSDLTPGCEASIGCHVAHWHLDMYSDTTEQFRAYLETAKTCKEYVAKRAVMRDANRTQGR